MFCLCNKTLEIVIAQHQVENEFQALNLQWAKKKDPVCLRIGGRYV